MNGWWEVFRWAWGALHMQFGCWDLFGHGLCRRARDSRGLLQIKGDVGYAASYNEVTSSATDKALTQEVLTGAWLASSGLGPDMVMAFVWRWGRDHLVDEMHDEMIQLSHRTIDENVTNARGHEREQRWSQDSSITTARIQRLTLTKFSGKADIPQIEGRC